MQPTEVTCHPLCAALQPGSWKRSFTLHFSGGRTGPKILRTASPWLPFPGAALCNQLGPSGSCLSHRGWLWTLQARVLRVLDGAGEIVLSACSLDDCLCRCLVRETRWGCSGACYKVRAVWYHTAHLSSPPAITAVPSLTRAVMRAMEARCIYLVSISAASRGKEAFSRARGSQDTCAQLSAP